MDKKKLLIIGGGFAGVNLMRKIDRTLYDVTIIDRNNYNCFPPLFYQVASSGLDPASISFPFRREVHKLKNSPTYHMGEVESIDIEKKLVTTQYETLPYDKLVIAAGTTNNFFNMPQLIDRVYTLKSMGEAMRCRNAILDRLEVASLSRSEAQRHKLLSFVVIGAGPTGVEIAGAIGEMKRYILQREYPLIREEEVNVTLVEGSDRVLRTMSEEASRDALKALKKLCVNVQLQKNMTSYENDTVTFSDGTSIEAGMVIWTAGVTAESFTVTGGELKKGPGNRYLVDEYNRAEGVDDIYIIGDISYHADDFYPRGCPQLAQVAIQQARTLARNLNSGEWNHPFRYHDKGSMATIGRNKAVADLHRLHLSGFPAWFTWMFVHLMSILGMRNKAVVLTNWMWAYFTYPTSLRLLLRASKFPVRPVLRP